MLEDPLIIINTIIKKYAIRTFISLCLYYLTYLSKHTVVCISLIKVKQMTYYLHQRNCLTSS